MTHPTDIMEKARELADKVSSRLGIMKAGGKEFVAWDDGGFEFCSNLIAAALAEARAVPDVDGGGYLKIAMEADRMMRIWQLNNPHAKSNSWAENDIGYWICKISLHKQTAVPDGYVPSDNGLDQRTAKGKAVAAILPMFLQTQRAQSDNGDGRSTIHECKAKQVISEVYDLLMIYCGSTSLQPLPAAPNPPIARGGQ